MSLYWQELYVGMELHRKCANCLFLLSYAHFCLALILPLQDTLIIRGTG